MLQKHLVSAFSKLTRRSSLLHSTTSKKMSRILDMTPVQLGNILKSGEKAAYQIIDVREPSELEVAKLKDSDVINLPLSQAGEWGEKVVNGEALDSSKPTICLCHHGVRSMKVATFLSKLNQHF